MSAKVYSMPGLSDEQLLELVRQDNLSAFDTLFRKYWVQLFNAAYKRLKDKDTCEEIVQDLFVHLYSIRHQLVIGQSLAAYLHSALRNRILNHIRHENTYHKYKEAAAQHQQHAYNHVELSVEYKDLERAVSYHVSQMPEKHRQVYVLNREGNLSVKEVAQHLNRPVSTVEKQLKKAIEFLKLHLKDFFVIVVTIKALFD